MPLLASCMARLAGRHLFASNVDTAVNRELGSAGVENLGSSAPRTSQLGMLACHTNAAAAVQEQVLEAPKSLSPHRTMRRCVTRKHYKRPLGHRSIVVPSLSSPRGSKRPTSTSSPLIYGDSRPKAQRLLNACRHASSSQAVASHAEDLCNRGTSSCSWLPAPTEAHLPELRHSAALKCKQSDSVIAHARSVTHRCTSPAASVVQRTANDSIRRLLSL